MPIIKNLESNDFLKFEKSAYKILSNNAKIAYLTFAYVHPNENITDKSMCNKCNLGLSTYKKAKAELIKNDYLYVQRLGTKGAIIQYHFGIKQVKDIKEYLAKKKLKKGLKNNPL